MSNFFKKLMGKPKGSKKAPFYDAVDKNKTQEPDIIKHPFNNEKLTSKLSDNLNKLKTIFTNCNDVIFREFIFAQNEDIRLVIVYTDGMVDKLQVSEQIMRALALEVPMVAQGQKIDKSRALDFIRERGLCIHQIKETNLVDDVVQAILSGDTVLLVEGHSTAIINSARGWEARSITESQAEQTVRGPREAFVETLRTNTSLLRRKIKNPNLKIEILKLGEVTNTDVAVVYIHTIVNDKIVTELKTRLKSIKIDGILETGYIEELIEDSPFSPFPTINHTEKPDRVAAALLEGRVAIMVDGTPMVLTLPNLFVEYLQFSEDYYERSIYASATRMLRFFALFASLCLPSLYIAVTSFHHELLPTTLLLSIAAQHEAVPFPVFVEVLAMELSFEVLREAGIRLPRAIGQAVSIVGALVIGEAAVQAGLVAPTTVIVVAFTGIASFVFFYSLSISFRLLRFMLMVLSATFGLFGLVTGIAILGIHLCTLRSFGVPYLSPLAPTTGIDIKDTIVRAPWWAMLTRPRLIGKKNLQRQETGQKPSPKT